MTSQAKANELFGHLELLLKERNAGRGFSTSTGDQRHDVSADEFMLMMDKPLEVGFKHRDTRNYVYLTKRGLRSEWNLFIPKTENLFHLGQFDTFEISERSGG